MKDILKSVTVLTADGQEKELTPGELDMSYRHSSITEEHYMVLGVTIALEAGSQEQIRAKMEELKEKACRETAFRISECRQYLQKTGGVFCGKTDHGCRSAWISGRRCSSI